MKRESSEARVKQLRDKNTGLLCILTRGCGMVRVGLDTHAVAPRSAGDIWKPGWKVWFHPIDWKHWRFSGRAVTKSELRLGQFLFTVCDWRDMATGLLLRKPCGTVQDSSSNNKLKQPWPSSAGGWSIVWHAEAAVWSVVGAHTRSN